MNAEEYLASLRGQLKGFSAAEQADILDEIAAHIESGMEDSALGTNPEERQAHLMHEIGSPEQLGRGLRQVHHPRRWVDLLWVLIPNLILLRLVQLFISMIYNPIAQPAPGDPHYYLGGRISLLLALVLILAGYLRRADLVQIFWTTSALGILASLMTREGRWMPGQELIAESTLESFICYVGLIGLLFWLVRTLRRSHFDLLLVVFALLPLLGTAANYGTALLIRTLYFTQNGAGLLVSPQLLWLAGITLFFLLRQRDARWFSLLLLAASSAYPNIVLYGFMRVIEMWSALLALVLLVWAVDWVRRQPDRRLVQ